MLAIRTGAPTCRPPARKSSTSSASTARAACASSARLGLTPTGVRQHLAILEREGLVANRELRGQVGRPALAFRLTPQAEQLYPKAYDELANAVLGAARSLLPAETYGSLVANTAEQLAAPHMEALARLSPAERVRATCELL